MCRVDFQLCIWCHRYLATEHDSIPRKTLRPKPQKPEALNYTPLEP